MRVGLAAIVPLRYHEGNLRMKGCLNMSTRMGVVVTAVLCFLFVILLWYLTNRASM